MGKWSDKDMSKFPDTKEMGSLIKILSSNDIVSSAILVGLEINGRKENVDIVLENNCTSLSCSNLRASKLKSPVTMTSLYCPKSIDCKVSCN